MRNIKTIYLLCYIILVIALYFTTVYVRYSEYTWAWKSSEKSVNNKQQEYRANGLPIATSSDAYTWMRLAKRYAEHKDPKFDDKIYYPDSESIVTNDIYPLISVYMYEASRLFNIDMITAGMYLVIFGSGLFIFPLAIYMYKVRFSAAAILGGFFGAFNIMYMIRTDAGRVDTDCLLLFFLFLIPLFFLLMQRAKSKKFIYLYASLAGLSNLLLFYWYQHTSFSFINMLVIVAVIALEYFRKNPLYNIKSSIIALTLFIIFSNPGYIVPGVKNTAIKLASYSSINILQDKSSEIKEGVYFPNVYSTVQEATKDKISQIINVYIINKYFFAFACICFFIMLIVNFRDFLPLIFIFALGFSIVFLPSRMIVYLMPVLGIAIGYFVHLIFRAISYFVTTNNTNSRIGITDPTPKSKFSDLNCTGLDFLSVILVFITVALIMLISAFKELDRSAFAMWVEPHLFIDARSHDAIFTHGNLPAGSAVYTWWDYGQMLVSLSNMATFHSGDTQHTPKTWLIAKSFVVPPDKMANIVAFISNKGRKGIVDVYNNAPSVEAGTEEIENYSEPLDNDNVYILYTWDLYAKYNAIQMLGKWDLVRNKPSDVNLEYSYLMCNNNNFCQNRYIDENNMLITFYGFKQGDPDRSTPKLLLIRSINRIDYVDVRSGLYTSSIVNPRQSADGFNIIFYRDFQSNANLAAFTANDEEYKSSFIQLFVLGIYDPDIYEQVYNNFPVSRTYKLKR